MRFVIDPIVMEDGRVLAPPRFDDLRRLLISQHREFESQLFAMISEFVVSSLRRQDQSRHVQRCQAHGAFEPSEWRRIYLPATKRDYHEIGADTDHDDDRKPSDKSGSRCTRRQIFSEGLEWRRFLMMFGMQTRDSFDRCAGKIVFLVSSRSSIEQVRLAEQDTKWDGVGSLLRFLDTTAAFCLEFTAMAGIVYHRHAGVPHKIALAMPVFGSVRRDKDDFFHQYLFGPPALRHDEFRANKVPGAHRRLTMQPDLFERKIHRQPDAAGSFIKGHPELPLV